jgi:hypothetical protein
LKLSPQKPKYKPRIYFAHAAVLGGDYFNTSAGDGAESLLEKQKIRLRQISGGLQRDMDL